MRLNLLLGEVAVEDVRGDPTGVEINAVSHDSRAVVAGTLFCCVRGASADGHHFAADAVRRGAVAVLCEHPLEVDVPQILVKDTRVALGPVAAAVHDHPSRSMTVVGVTGTNGKTTTTHFLRAVFEAHGWRAGVIGSTTGHRTTPEAPELQAALAALRDEGVAAVAMEVSSPALVARRVDGMRFAVAVFTNLGRDHLDVHGDMESYFAAKAMLFTPELAERGVVNGDDDAGQRLLADAGIPLTPFSMADADDLQLRPAGSRFRWRDTEIDLRVAGRHNVANALAAAAAAAELGVPTADVARGLAAVETVPGHLEWIPGDRPYRVAVDYAHTPEALSHLLRSARELTTGRVLLVFGCGGERDPGKRPLMGRQAANLADLAVLTSDNPRHEDPLAIIEQVRSGIEDPDRLRVEPDRHTAIRVALEAARPGDVVIVAGKGAEQGQEIGDDVVPFDDRDEVRRLFASGVGA